MQLLYTSQARKLDMLMEEKGVSCLKLVEAAAAQVASVVRELMPVGDVLVIAGRGNNGADGLAAARILAEEGRNVYTIVLAGDASMLNDNARICLKALERATLSFSYAYTEEGFNIAVSDMMQKIDPAIVIDSIFGTGLSKTPDGSFKSAINFVNKIDAVKVSVDVPSGVNASTGSITDPCVKADVTVCMHLPKVGELLYPGMEMCGELRVADIGIDVELDDNLPELSELDLIQNLIPKRNPNAHKGNFGHVVLFGGSRGMAGAGEMMSKACMRSGAGTATLACSQSLLNIYMTKLTEVMVTPLPDDNRGMLTKQSITYLPALLQNASSIAIGPGWGKGMELSGVLQAILAQSKVPVVIDADGLNAFSRMPDYRRILPRESVITPHPGEMSRLANVNIDELLQNPIEHAKRFAEKSNAVVLLKGGSTVIAAPDGRVAINSTGNPGMATAGSGDVLTGVIAALLAQGLSAFDAARVGALIHGRAGDIAASVKGEAGLIASDIIESIPDVFSEYGR